MKIAILSLQLHVNYGGLLQSYALKSILSKMGNDVTVLNKPVEWEKEPLIFLPFYIIARLLKKKLGKYKGPLCSFRNYPTLSSNTQKFIDKYIKPRDIDSFSEIKEQDYEALVVGSDQVWRPGTFQDYQWKESIANAYLKFAEEWDVKRIAYAASFGVDQWEYTNEDTDNCSRLAKKFNAISVREQSAIALCTEHLGVNAEQVLDPTLLLPVEEYMSLITDEPKSNGDLLTYILDANPIKDEITNAVAEHKGLKAFSVNGKKSKNIFVTNPKPKVETWLKGFYDAKFVITDSFHACVFSLLFSKPFVVIGNKKRGMSRFTSFLHMFNLEDHIVSSVSDIDFSKSYDIPQSVQDKLDQLRNHSMNFLKQNLAK